MAFLDFANNLIDQAEGIFGGPTSSNDLVNGAVGMFLGGNITPQSGVGQLAGSMVVPQNSGGLGIFNNVLNNNAVGKVIGSIGGQLVAGAVQYGGTNKSITPVTQTSLNAVKAIGLPIAAGAATTIQAQSLTAGGIIDDVKKEIGLQTSGDDTLLWVGISALITKLLKLW